MPKMKSVSGAAKRFKRNAAGSLQTQAITLASYPYQEIEQA